MKHALIILLTVCLTISATAQQKKPKWLERTEKAIFTVEATTKEGMTRTAPGFFIHENGEAVASYDIFKKAEKAVVVTATGERLSVGHILGIDEVYGVIRFKVSVPKKTVFLPVAKISPILNSTAYLPPSKEEKNLGQGMITEIAKVSSVYDYYKVELPLPQSQVGYPLLNEAGEVFALTQSDASGKGNTYGIAVAYIQSLKFTTTDLLKNSYADMGIRKSWSSDFEEARIALLLYASQQDAPTYLETLNDFITSFPAYAEGYISRASHYAYRRQELATTESEQLKLLDLAWNDLESAAKYIKNKGETNFNKARLIFGIISIDSTLSYKNWTLQSAEENIQKAIAEQNSPVYHQLKGDIAFFKKDFEKAYESYAVVNHSSESSGSSFYWAAKSMQQIPGANIMEIITLIDSAVAKSYRDDAAAFLLENIDLKLQVGLYEQAVNDYDKYFILKSGNVSHEFYYYREQAKFRTGDLDGALRDIETAIAMENADAIYYAERASVYLRMQNLPKAQENAQKAIELEPEFASAYRLLGVCFVRQDKQAEACVQFEKAKALGDPVVDRLINENCNVTSNKNF